MLDGVKSRAAALFHKKPVAEIAPKEVEEVKVDEVASKVEKAATVAIETAKKPSVFARARSWSKAVGADISNAAKKAFNIKDKAELEAIKSKAEFENVKKEQVALFKGHAKELTKSISGFENIEEETNEFSSTKKRFESAIKVLVKDLNSLDGNVSREEFLDILNAAIKDPNARIFADSRYGEAFKGINKSISIPRFIKILLANISTASQKVYAKEVSILAKKFAKALKDVRNNDDATKFNHDKFQAVSELAEKKEYQNLLGKNKSQIAKDLDSQIIAQLGGKRAVEKLIAQIESIINSPYDFGKVTASKRSVEETRVAPMLKDMNVDLASLYKRLEELEDQEKAYAKEMLSLLELVRNPEESAEKRKEAEATIAEIDNKRMLTLEQIQKLSGDVDFTKAEKTSTLESFRADYLRDLNAQRRELGSIVGKTLDDIETLPREATKMDAVKRYSKNAAIYAGIPAAIIAGAAYGYYRYDPSTATWIVMSAKDGVTSGAGYVSGKVVDGASFVASTASKAGSAIAAQAGNVKGYVASTRVGQSIGLAQPVKKAWYSTL